MTNLPITGNNSQRSANIASSSQIEGTTNTQAYPFGAVLARQMDEANASAPNMPSSAAGVDTRTTADSAGSAGNAEQDKVPVAASTPGDPSSALAVMLQLPQEIRTPVAKDETARTAATAHEPSAGKAGANQLPDIIGASQVNARIDPATAASGRPDVAIVAIGGPALHSGSGLEISKSAELSNSLLSAQSSQGIALPAASMATSGIPPGMLTNGKTADSLQTISSPLGNSSWAGDFSQKIIWMCTHNNQVAELQLNPPDFGPLNVVLKISDNQATAMFTSPHSAVREAVENAMPKLREILADNGIMLGNTTVSDQSPRDRSADGFMNQGSGAAAQRGISGGAPESTCASPAITQTMPARRHNGMVDTFA
ncbi:MAG: flagellar hook-length control protein FliK [Nitrosomonadales bacterium]|nr:flagellar hook-length control protein FliK [Nitrosomonadales bacterium]